MLSEKENRKIKIEVLSKTIFRTLLRYSMALGVISLTVAVFSLDIFNLQKDTFSFTNYGFAIMASYSAICFSWARNIKSEETSIFNKINFLATSSIYGGITFLLGSTFKYIYIQKRGELFVLNFDISNILKYTSYVCLTYALLMFCAVSIQILKVIDKNHENKTKKSITAKIKGKKLADKLESELMATLEKYSKKS